MATRPTKYPRWADGGTGTPTNTTEPLSATKDSGYLPGNPLPAQVFNWLLNLLYQWVEWLDQQTTAPTPHYVGDAGEPAFQNGWGTNAGGSKLCFWLDADGVTVHLGGYAVNAAVPAIQDQPIFQLPAGYYPTGRTVGIAGWVAAGTNVTGVGIDQNGNVYWNGTTGGVGSAFLDGLSFRKDLTAA